MMEMDWSACPLCGSNNFDGGQIDIEDPVVNQRLRCNECDGTWTETYVAYTRSEIETGEKQ